MEPNLASYDTIIVAFSGGKDSLACLLHLFDLGVPKEKIELWHHDVDGREGSTLMDWPVTRAYCRAIAKALDVPLFFSWKVGGFEREMLRRDTATAPTAFEVPMGTLGDFHADSLHDVAMTGGKGKPGTRRKYPQVSADLKVRWCSAYLKIDVGACALRNQARFERSRTLFVTGERAEESPGRAKYATLEKHRSDAREGGLGRHIDQWRPVHAWTEQQVWDVIASYRINPHPAYQLGWGRVSCAACIFGSKDQFASLLAVNPAQFYAVAGYEVSFGLTIKRKVSLPVLAASGVPYPTITPELIALATSHTFDAPVILAPGEWKLPAGAFGESCGPT